MRAPQHLLDVWPKLEGRLAHVERVALFLDYDGTLTRIRRRPADALLGSAMREVLVRIARTRVLMGVVTGRGLADVRALVGIGGIWYAGDHGYSLVDPLQRLIHLENSAERARLEGARRRLGRELKNAPGIFFDSKAASVAVHYRAASPAAARRAEEIVREAVAADPGLRVWSGKKVWEVLPGDRVDKWTGIQLILRRSGGKRREVIFVGDDVTDERVFRKMTGISVFVGTGRATAARYWLRSPAEVREFLRRCEKLWRE